MDFSHLITLFAIISLKLFKSLCMNICKQALWTIKSNNEKRVICRCVYTHHFKNLFLNVSWKKKCNCIYIEMNASKHVHKITTK